MSRITSLFALFILFLCSGCAEYVNFNIKTPGIDNGTFIIKNDAGLMTYSGNIKAGKLDLAKQMLEQPGYYTMTISNDKVKGIGTPFEIYLEPGSYEITTNVNDATVYPKITSASPIQHELSVYYNAVTTLNSNYYRNERMKLVAQVLIHLPKEQLMELAKKMQTAQETHNGEIPEETNKTILKEFIKQNPHSLAAVHLMTGMEFNTDAAAFYTLYNSLANETKNTDEGKALGAKLSILAKLVTGGAAPAIAGTTPDGKPFNVAGLNKKIYLVEFWKAANDVSRLNHSATDVTNMLSGIPGKKDFGMISISLDEKRDWWTSAIKDDKMDWPQYSDLKGNDSPNAANWAITRIPTYYLVDGSWHIIARDVPLMEVPVDVNEYLKKH
jgi:hypothetical protein